MNLGGEDRERETQTREAELPQFFPPQTRGKSSLSRPIELGKAWKGKGKISSAINCPKSRKLQKPTLLTTMKEYTRTKQMAEVF